MWKKIVYFIGTELIRLGLKIIVSICDRDLIAVVMDNREAEISVYALRQFMTLEYKKYLSPPEKLDYGFLANDYRHDFAEEEVQTITTRIVLAS